MNGTRHAGFPHDGDTDVEAHLVESESGEETEPEPELVGERAGYLSAAERERRQKEARRAYEEAGGVTGGRLGEEPEGPAAAPPGPGAGGPVAPGATAEAEAEEVPVEAVAPEGVAPERRAAHDALSEQLAAAVALRDEYLDSLRRLQAEFENYRKRVMRNESAAAERATERIVEKLLPVLDTLDLAQRHVAQGQSVEGAVGMIAGALDDVLSREGLTRIDPDGEPFDPAEHEAVAHIAAEVSGDGGEPSAHPEVVEVMRPGWRWKGRVLRPAMVKVRG